MSHNFFGIGYRCVLLVLTVVVHFSQHLRSGCHELHSQSRCVYYELLRKGFGFSQEGLGSRRRGSRGARNRTGPVQPTSYSARKDERSLCVVNSGCGCSSRIGCKNHGFALFKLPSEFSHCLLPHFNSNFSQ